MSALFENKVPTGGNKPAWSVQAQLPDAVDITHKEAGMCNNRERSDAAGTASVGHKSRIYQP